MTNRNAWLQNPLKDLKFLTKPFLVFIEEKNNFKYIKFKIEHILKKYIYFLGNNI